jgi:hypothetical protein
MSSYERNKGRLIPTGIDTENFDDDAIEMYEENGFVVIDGEIYKAEFEVYGSEYSGFSYVNVDDKGVIHFHTLHHNDGAHWTEVVESRL